nr:cellulase [uncultured bacterium]
MKHMLAFAGLAWASQALLPPPEGGALLGVRLYVDPQHPARRLAEEWRARRPREAALLAKIAEQPQAIWLGDWVPDVAREVERIVRDAARQGAWPVLVAYNIPGRDCSQYSAGGADGADAYRQWIRAFARGLRAGPAIVVLEPDALAGLDCLAPPAREERIRLLRVAVEVLSAAGARVYVDAGHPRWHTAEEMASRLERVGVRRAAGFALNVSNFVSNRENVAYGERIAMRLGGNVHFVIDTSRNGLATADGQWCNPRGQSLGTNPTTRTGHPWVDAYLWIKRPGESDGSCNGGPRAGVWWTEYALELARNQTRDIALGVVPPIALR